MKHSYLHKIYAFTLSLVVLFSTLSFTVEKHYCGDHLVDTAIFSDAKKCGGLEIEDSNYVTKPCCKDTVDVIQGLDELKTTDLQKINPSSKLTLVAYIYSYTHLFESLPKQVIPHKNYDPPNLFKDIHVLDETFLI
ncbi:HYC_CC_PP family protein [Winogradskyella sp.]|uniref:HYC_CC_PP family protein n=1 Tax=Winogradskyella sp. TaxID=1883156 RepID=UPI003F6D0F08